FLSAKQITTSGIVAESNPEMCIGCGRCVEVCPYNAIELIETSQAYEEVSLVVKKSFIHPALCKGCGTCAATCPNGAIAVKHYDFDQIISMIETYLDKYN
ncbi:hypothetical protein LCGC14_1417750, partial [marine sediment metagenome]